MNLSVTHNWRNGNFKSVFRINCAKTLINIMYNQETQSEMGCGREKP